MSLLKKMKAAPALRDIPVIMATAKGAEYDKIQSLDLGADDYLVKPFGVMEMVSRVKAVLRRCHPADTGHVLSAGGLSMDLDCRTVTADGQRLQLTYKEFELLRLFRPIREWHSPENSYSHRCGIWSTWMTAAHWICTSAPCGRS